MNSAIYKNTFITLTITRLDVGGVSHAAFRSKGRHDTAESFGPVARPEFLPCLCDSNDDKVFGDEMGHVSMRGVGWLWSDSS